MSGASPQNDTPIENKQMLVDYLAAGCKPREDWRIGTKNSHFVYPI